MSTPVLGTRRRGLPCGCEHQTQGGSGPGAYFRTLLSNVCSVRSRKIRGSRSIPATCRASLAVNLCPARVPSGDGTASGVTPGALILRSDDLNCRRRRHRACALRLLGSPRAALDCSSPSLAAFNNLGNSLTVAL